MNGLEARKAAHGIITEWLGGDRYLEHIMQFDSQVLSPADKRFAESLVHHVIRHYRTLETIVKHYIRRRPNRRIYTVILMGACEICLMNVKEHAAIHSSVELAGQIQEGAKGFVNAVLRRVLHFYKHDWPGFFQNEKYSLGERYSFPDWMVNRWRLQFGDELPALLESLNRTPVKMARIVKTDDRDHIIQTLKELKAFGGESDYHKDYVNISTWQPVLSHDIFTSGKLIAQDVSAAWPVELMRSSVSEGRVLDLCSAPGGKLSALRQYLPEAVKVQGYDISANRLMQVKDTLLRLNMNDVDLAVADAVNDHYPMAEGILLDAPCSGFGVIRKRSDLRWRRQEADMDQLFDLQHRILNNAAKFLRSGGTLVYSTCTFDREENDLQVDTFLAEHPEFSVIMPRSDRIPREIITAENALATFPHRHLCEGSFAICLQKH